MSEQTSEALRAWFRRVEPMVPELFNIAHAICGNYDRAEYALRGAILRGDWQNVRDAMPQEAFAILCDAAAGCRLHRPDALDSALLYRLRTMTTAEYAALPDLSEGIEHRLMGAAQSAVSREALLQAAKTRRYPYARLSRLAAHALLGMTTQQLTLQPMPQFAWLLGFRRDSQGIFAHFKEKGSLPILGKAADLNRHDPAIAAELKAYDIWALGAGLPAGLALTQGVAVI